MSPRQIGCWAAKLLARVLRCALLSARWPVRSGVLAMLTASVPSLLIWGSFSRIAQTARPNGAAARTEGRAAYIVSVLRPFFPPPARGGGEGGGEVGEPRALPISPLTLPRLR